MDDGGEHFSWALQQEEEEFPEGQGWRTEAAVRSERKVISRRGNGMCKDTTGGERNS